jgi:hypothetical protein
MVLNALQQLMLRGRRDERVGRQRLASLFRLVLIVAILAGLGLLGMLALVTFVEPEPHEIVQPLQLPRINK